LIKEFVSINVEAHKIRAEDDKTEIGNQSKISSI
jgi:hypothetical protein